MPALAGVREAATPGYGGGYCWDPGGAAYTYVSATNRTRL